MALALALRCNTSSPNDCCGAVVALFSLRATPTCRVWWGSGALCGEPPSGAEMPGDTAESTEDEGAEEAESAEKRGREGEWENGGEAR